MFPIQNQDTITKINFKSRKQRNYRLFDSTINDNFKSFVFNSNEKINNRIIVKRNISQNNAEKKFNLTNYSVIPKSKQNHNGFYSILPRINTYLGNQTKKSPELNKKLVKVKNLNNSFEKCLYEKKTNNTTSKKPKFNLKEYITKDSIKKKLFLKIEESKNNTEDLIYDTKILTTYFSKNNYASLTLKGYNSLTEEKQNNQDRTLILDNIFGINNFNIYGVMDGHGSNGHLVSNFIKTKIEKFFKNKLNLIRKKSKNNFVFDLNYIKKKLINNNYKIIRNLYKNINDEIYFEQFDVHFSGSTLLLIFRVGDLLISANTGDSKGILVKNKTESIDLNIEHKPTDTLEKNRIESSGGVVSQCNDLYDDGKYGGPFRVWKKGCDYPGLSLSRSIGDLLSKEIGVIYEPDILTFNIDKNCNYLVIGSDGVWEYLSNQDVMSIVNKLYKQRDLEKICKNIIRKSTELYLQKENRIDDISVSVIFLNYDNDIIGQ